MNPAAPCVRMSGEQSLERSPCSAGSPPMGPEERPPSPPLQVSVAEQEVNVSMHLLDLLDKDRSISKGDASGPVVNHKAVRADLWCSAHPGRGCPSCDWSCSGQSSPDWSWLRHWVVL